MRAIPQPVLVALDSAICSGPYLQLNGKLDSAVYRAVNKVIEAAGGKWNRLTGRHVFKRDAREAIEEVLAKGGVGPKQELGQFDSPTSVVERVMALAGIQRGMTVLEPSAGLGALALGACRYSPTVTCVEIDQARCAELERLGHFTVIRGDFTDLVSLPLFDRIVMNPPFAAQADIDHVIHAATFLKPGGRLVSVMSSGVVFRTNSKTVAFRKWLALHGAVIHELPEGSFRASGTSVQACIVSFDMGEPS